MKRTKHNLRLLLAGGIIALFACFTAGAANILKLDVTNALTDPLSWTGGVVPGSADIAQWNGTYASTNAWTLGASTNWAGIQILSVSRALTILNDSNTLTVGASGIDLSQANNNFTFNIPLNLSAAQVWAVTNGRTLQISAGVTNTGSLISITNIAAAGNGGTVQIGNSATNGSVSGNIALVGGATLVIARTDTVTPIGGTISGNATNCLVRNGSTLAGNTNTLTFADGINTFGGILNASPGAMVLNASANCTNYFRNPNGLASTGPLHNAKGNTNIMVINGGTWIVTNALNNNGSGSSGTTWSGTNYLTNSVFIAGDARYTHGVTYIQNGATFAVTNASGSRISFDNQDAGSTEGFYVQPGGTLNAWATQYGFQLGSATAGGYANATTFIQQSGGLVQVGMNGGGGSKNLLLGEGSSSATTYYNLSGGKLMVAGTIQTNSNTAITSANSFNWTGGTLVANAINMGVVGSGAISGGVLTNAGGTMAPGDVGTAGKTAVTGNYVQNAGSLAIDIGGTSQANAFTNASGYYDLVAVTGSAAINGGTLNVNFINGYTPPATTTAFTVLTTTTGITGSPVNFANNYNGYIPVSLSPLKYMQAVVIGNNLVLTNYGVTPPTVAASFTPTNAVGVAPFTVAFSDTSVGAITNRHWNFGDGGTTNTTATSVSYTYNAIGTYTNVLTVYDAAGNSSSATGVVHATSASVSLTWKGDGVANDWNTSSANWLNGATAATYADPDNVTFDDTGSATPNLALNFGAQPASVTFNNTAENYTIAGSGGIDGSANIALNGSGSVTLLTTNSTTGTLAVNSGTLQLGNGTTSGSLDNVSVITDTGALVFNQPDNHNIAAVISGGGSLTKTGAGTLTLGATNSGFSGPVAVNGGTLSASSLAGLGSGSLAVSNATVGIGSGGTLNNSLTLAGTNVGINVSGTLILPASPAGSAAVTVGGTGTLQVDQGGASVTLPTNIVLNGGSIVYQRNDIFAQPGVISGVSANSSINNASTSAGNTNTLTFADGVNVFGNIQNTSAGTLVLNGSANSTNILGGTSGLGYAGNAEIIFDGGTFNITNAQFNGSAANNSTGNLVINGGTVNSAFYNGNNGGAYNVRGNLTINGGTLHIGSGRLGMYNNSSQVFTLNGGNVLIDTVNGSPNYGIRFGAVNGATQPGVGMTGIQTGGSITISATSGFDLGCTNAGQISKYLLSGGSISLMGGDNLTLGSDTNGTGSTTFLLTNTAKLSLTSGTVSGVGNTNNVYTAVQVFSFVGGTFAGSVNATYLRDSAANAPGTFVNGGGTFLPGDAGYAGRSTITGNFSNAPTAALGIEIGGTTAAVAGQETVNTNRYDNVLIVGTNASVELAGNLNVSLINGFEPIAGANSQFIILSFNNSTNSIGTPSLTGGFTNVSAGRVTLVGDPTRSFAVTVNSTNVVLSNYQTPSVQAYFTQSTNAGTAPLTVTFTNLSNGSGLTNLWNFGDGGTSTLAAATVTHTYTSAGTNTVSLTVGSALGVNTYTVSNAVAVTVPAGPTGPASITNFVSGSSLVLTWPSGQGWVLEAQTNSLAIGLGTNWVRLTTATSPFTNTISPADGSVFYRLVYP